MKPEEFAKNYRQFRKNSISDDDLNLHPMDPAQDKYYGDIGEEVEKRPIVSAGIRR